MAVQKILRLGKDPAQEKKEWLAQTM